MVITRRISLQTKGNTDIIDITDRVAQQVTESGLNDGSVNVFVTGSTASITTIEFEPGLISDLKTLWERLVPRSIGYNHDKAWGDGNGYSHVRASLLGASLVVPFNEKKMLLGTWQQIILVDFDNRPRSRQIVVQITGD